VSPLSLDFGESSLEYTCLVSPLREYYVYISSKSSARRNFAPSQPKSPPKEIIQIILLSLFTLLPVLSSKVYKYHSGFCSFWGVWSLGEYAHEPSSTRTTGTRLLKQRFPPALPHHPSTCKHLTSSLLQPQNLPISTHQQCCVLG
jgi:hypothetical protein